MTWGTLLPKQFVSFADANESPLSKHVAITPSAQFMTKDDALYYLDIAHANLDIIAEGNRWVWRELLVSGRATAWRGITPFCVQLADVRPTGMITMDLLYSKYSNGVRTYFADTLANATQAYADYISTVYSISGGQGQMVSVAVGYRCYWGTGSSLSGPIDGYYLTGNQDSKVYHFVSSYLTQIISI